MAKFKLGDRVNIEVEKKRTARRARPASAREPHKGAIRRIEDPQDTQGAANIVFVDSSMVWLDKASDGALVLNQGDEHPLPVGVMCYVEPSGQSLTGGFVADLSDLHIDSLRQQWQQAMFNLAAVKLPPLSGTTYRTIEKGMPLPVRGVDVLGLSLKLGGRTFQVREGNQFRKVTPASARLDAAVNRGADAAVIANLEHEVHESSFATGQSICRENIDPQLWFTHAERDQRDLWRDYGIFRPRMATGGYLPAVASPIHFEPFDLKDTANYKIVKRLDGGVSATFDAPEVQARKISVAARSKPVKIYLVPQLWHVTFTYNQQISDQWLNTDDSSSIFLTWSQAITDSGYVPAFSSPYVLSGWETPINGITFEFPNHPAYLHAYGDTAYDPADAGDASFLRLMMQLSGWQRIAADNFSRLINPTSPGTPSPGAGYTYVSSSIFAQSDGHAVVTQQGSPAKALVGGIEYGDRDSDDDRYFVFRKTARAVETVTIYDGPYDDPAFNSVNTIVAFATPDCLKRVTSAAWSGSYPANRWTWATGGLCASDSLWPYLMLPRWSGI